MKKFIVVLLALVMLLCTGCEFQIQEFIDSLLNKGNTVETTDPSDATEPQETEGTEPTVPEETIPVPDVTMATALVDNTPAVLVTLMREDTVDVVGEYDENHYLVKTELGYGLVEKVMLRLEGEEPYQTWTGYAYSNAEVYDNFNMTGEPVKKLGLNTKVEVLDALEYCYVVRVDDSVAYINKSRISQRQISTGGGAGADGGDISLQFQGGMTNLSAVEQSGEVTGQATVLADGTEVILAYFNRGEEIPVVAEEGFAESREGYVTVYLDGLYAYVPQMLVLAEGAEAYEAWNGYSTWNGAVYDNYYLLGDPVSMLYTNLSVHVIAELDNCYLVEANNVTGFMLKDQVSKTQIPVSNNSGSAEWSPPAL